jgi:D-alanine transaminase
MTRISYLNGEFLPHENCLVHIEDRGFQFADGVYEVTLFENNKLIDGDAHIERLFRSLREMKIEHNFTKEEIYNIQIELFKKNQIDNATCYLQITRGFANRIPFFPKDIKPTISATVSVRKNVSDIEFEKGIKVITHEDIRWKRCDIKSVALFASSFVNQKAKDQGFDDAIFIRDGFITEATFANLFIVDKDDNLITKAASNQILQGITRNRIIQIAKENNINFIEKNFAIDELMRAKEIFLTSSSLIVRAVIVVDDKIINDGKVGQIASLMRKKYQEFILN